MNKTFQKAHILVFLKKNVMGRSIISPPETTYIDGDRIIATSEEDAIFSNLNETDSGFSFDMTTLARGTRYINGKKLLAEGTMNAVRVIRYEMTERLSTGDVLGHARFLSSTNSQPDPFGGTIFQVKMYMKDDQLIVDEIQIGYADVMSADGNFKPLATDGQYIYTMTKNKLTVKYQQKTFEIDPETMRKTPTNDKYPVQVSSEITFPAKLEAVEN